MSIIHEALKKATRIKKGVVAKEAVAVETQKESQTLDSDNKITSINLGTQPVSKKGLPKKQKPLILPFAIISMLILIAITSFLLNNYFLFKKPQIQTANITTTDRTLSSSPSIIDMPLEDRGSSETFVLSGIVYEDREPMAVINNSIYTVGEYVNGAEIVKITSSRVLLKKADQEIELKMKKGSKK